MQLCKWVNDALHHNKDYSPIARLPFIWGLPLEPMVTQTYIFACIVCLQRYMQTIKCPFIQWSHNVSGCLEAECYTKLTAEISYSFSVMSRVSLACWETLYISWVQGIVGYSCACNMDACLVWDWGTIGLARGL